jgi:ACT domain-containing protein
MARNSRKLLIAIPVLALLGVLLLYQYGYLALRSEIGEIRGARERKLRLLTRQMSLISRKANLETERESLIKVRKAVEVRLIDGTTAALAGELMRQNAKAIITGKGGTVVSDTMEKAQEAGKFSVVSAVFDVAFPDIKAFSDALCAVEASPDLVIRELDARIKDHGDPKDFIVRFQIAALTAGK